MIGLAKVLVRHHRHHNRLLARDRPDKNRVPCHFDYTNTVFYFGRPYTISKPTPGSLQ